MRAEIPADPFAVTATVRLVEGGLKSHSEDYIAVIGEDIRIDPSLLQKYCFASPTTEAIDLVTVLGAIRFADRAVKRQHVYGWSRSIHVSVPVFDVSRWAKTRTLTKLQQCISYLTGDAWEFAFTKRRSGKRLAAGHTDHLVEMPKAEYVGIPYSDGLDSYAQAKLLSSREPESRLICTYTDYKGGIRSWNSLCDSRESELKNIHSIPVPFQVVEPHHAEVSFRSRPFIFYTLAAYGAMLAGSSRVLIPENGQGSIGGSLVMLGNEAPHRSCYPGFLSRLSGLLTDLLGRAVQFEHPALLQTKGQVLTALVDVEPSLVWMRKWSCSHDQRHSSLNGKRVHCGVCGGCVLRRVSFNAAGVDDKTEYLFHKLDTRTLETSVSTEVKAMDAMRDVAGNSVRDMQRLADLALFPDDSRLHEVALDVSDANKTLPTFALDSVRDLLQKHRKEWMMFLDVCGTTSWVRALAIS